MNTRDWFLFGEWLGIGWFHSCYAYGLARTIRERLGYGLTQVIVRQEHGLQKIIFSRSEWTDIGRRYLEDILKDPDLLSSVLRETRDAASKLIALSHDMQTADFSDMSIAEAADWFSRYHSAQHEVWTLGMIPNVLELENSHLTDYLKAWLRDGAGLPDTELINVFQLLVKPRELSQAQKEEREMLTLAQSANPKDALIAHWQKYKWLMFGWTGPDTTLEYFTVVHRGLFEQGDAQKRLAELHSADAGLETEKEEIISRLNIPQNIGELFVLLEELLFIKAHRMDALFYSYCASQNLLARLAKEYYISVRQIYNVYPVWLLKMIEENKIDEHYINALGDNSLLFFENGEDRLLVGNEASEFMGPIEAALPKTEELRELKGECGYPGIVAGTVCVVNTAAEMSKFTDGNVLVSIVTDPSLLPIMKKASAFVTNQGGLTCHAAIVARELHIPCVIGTKIATKILKDGDRVEVDATNGIVRKI